MSKIERLNELFERWKKAHTEETQESLLKTISGNNIKPYFFEKDGIIDEDAFEKERIKVLFISAEANADEYNAKEGIYETDYRQAYLSYFESGKDDWGGKMRERLCGIYKYLTHQPNLILKEAANKFAVMDINKRGGKSTIDKGKHLVAYTELYKSFINEEIKVINPDVVVLVGVNLCELRIVQRLGCLEEDNKCFFQINGKKVPILLSLQTAYVHYQAGRYPPLDGCDNKAIGILCSYLRNEIEKYRIKEMFNLD